VSGGLALNPASPNALQLVNLNTNRAASSVTSGDLRLNMVPLPRISASPQPAGAVVGGSATFRVVASGSNLRYQWFRSGSRSIAGATGPTLTLLNLAAADADSYSVVISNEAGSVTGGPAALTVSAAPSGTGGAAPGSNAISTEALGQAVDALVSSFLLEPLVVPELIPTGTAWVDDTSVRREGSSSRSSGGGLNDGQSRSAELTVVGPGELTFSWKVSSEFGFDYLTLEVDGLGDGRISGDSDWETVTRTIGPGSHLVRWIYSKDGSVSRGSDRGWVDSVFLRPSTGGVAWTTGGDANWRPLTGVTHDGVDAVTNGDIGNSQVSWMQAVANGPATLSFWWRVSSEASFDFLRILVDGNEQDKISGNVDWTQKFLTLSEGRHVIRWSYTKDSSVVGGEDHGYVDQVEISPLNLVFSTQPAGQSFATGQNLSLSATMASSGTFSYQWKRDGIDVSGGTGSVLNINNAQIADAGAYTVTERC
jgi:hypothetical protein